MDSQRAKLLVVEGLTVAAQSNGRGEVLSEVSFEVGQGEIVALVGGSGSGKTTIGMSVMRLLPSGLSIVTGRVLFQGQDLAASSQAQMRALRGGGIAMVFQDPLASLNPVFTIGAQIREVIRQHRPVRGAVEERRRILALLTGVGIDEAERVMRSYPHQLSGGMRQRAMIAQALAGEPRLMIADEPTSSVDVTLQAKILELFRQIRRERGVAMLVITHDLGLVRALADRVVVLHEGRVVEQGPVAQVIDHPRQGYTQQLLRASLLERVC